MQARANRTRSIGLPHFYAAGGARSKQREECGGELVERVSLGEEVGVGFVCGDYILGHPEHDR